MIKITPVTSSDHFVAVRTLLEEYVSSRPGDPALEQFDEEFVQLETLYAPPDGQMLIAHQDQKAVGCVALHSQDEEDICEMKRLYVSPGHRNCGIGRGLVMTLLIEAEKAGYQRMRLDSIPSMKAAQELYRSIGFYEIADYRNNPNPGTRYFEITFSQPQPAT